MRTTIEFVGDIEHKQEPTIDVVGADRITCFPHRRIVPERCRDDANATVHVTLTFSREEPDVETFVGETESRTTDVGVVGPYGVTFDGDIQTVEFDGMAMPAWLAEDDECYVTLELSDVARDQRAIEGTGLVVDYDGAVTAGERRLALPRSVRRALPAGDRLLLLLDRRESGASDPDFELDADEDGAVEHTLVCVDADATLSWVVDDVPDGCRSDLGDYHQRVWRYGDSYYTRSRGKYHHEIDVADGSIRRSVEWPVTGD